MEDDLKFLSMEDDPPKIKINPTWNISMALAPWSAHARPSAQPPIDTSGNFARICLGGGQKTREKIPIDFLAISGDF